MNIRIKCILVFIFCISVHLFSQINPSYPFINSIPIDSGWTKVEMPTLGKISGIRVSAGLEYKQDPTGQLWVKAGNTPKQLFHIEFHSNGFPYLQIFTKSISNSNLDSTLNKLSCTLSFEKFTDRKLYITANTVPDELYALWDNTMIPHRRSGKTISIHLPAYVDTVEKSFIRLYAVKNQQVNKELIIQLLNGKPTQMSESFSGIAWGGTKEIKFQSSEKSLADKVPEVVITHIQNTPAVEIKDKIIEEDQKVSGLPSWISVYADAYYALYNDSVGINQDQKFPSIAPKSNSFGLNTVQINFQYDAEKIRGAASFHYGDYARTNWSETYNNIMEAHAGVRLTKKFWIDAGFFRTHIGTEGLLPRENICSSTAIATYHEPAMVSAFRLNYIPSDKWMFYFYLMNSYNGFVDNNNKKSIGMLATYVMNEHINFGYSNYLGDDTPEEADSISHFRIYQNVFFNYQLEKLKLQLGVDFCVQKNSDLIDAKKSASMFSGVATGSYTLGKMISVYSRFEYFTDPNAFVSSPITDASGKLTGYKLWGVTAGIELRPLDKLFIRFEGRQLEMDADQQIFLWNGKTKSTRSELILNMGIIF